ncbi:putative pectate lyase 17 isoform X2 [Rutidosis leptorrhynchoides]|uniref:putative pectate lyase 17 isoform X2 n=1 Tax=Rutidosis leptorrhynchoides TaxID=125765 RepID=UPI003A996B1A
MDALVTLEALDLLFDSSEDEACIKIVQLYEEIKGRKRGDTSRKRARGTTTARQRTPPSQIALKIPYSNVDSTLRSLAAQAEGFGRFATGGLHGEIYHVTTLSDDGPGSLRAGCRMKEPLWIVFEVSGTIELSSSLNVSSYKTIDGRGQRIKLTRKGIRLYECEHVIICNLELEGGRGPDVGGIQIKTNSKNIWIDRCSLKDFDDGLIDISYQSTNITISRCHFSNHDKTMLIGADALHHGDRCMNVTIHHCFFDGTRQCHPCVRFAKVHLYNNYTRDWGIYAVCASVESQAGDKEEASTGCIISEGDLFMSGTQPGSLEHATSSSSFHPTQHYQTWTLEPATKELQQVLQHCTGWQAIPRPPASSPSSLVMGRERARKAVRSSISSNAETTSRRTNSSKMEEFIESVNAYKSIVDKKSAKYALIAEKLRRRTAMEAAKFLTFDTDKLPDPDDRKLVMKLKMVMAKRYKKYLEISDDDDNE